MAGWVRGRRVGFYTLRSFGSYMEKVVLGKEFNCWMPLFVHEFPS